MLIQFTLYEKVSKIMFSMHTRYKISPPRPFPVYLGPRRAFPGPVGFGARSATGVHSGDPPQSHGLRAFGEPTRSIPKLPILGLLQSNYWFGKSGWMYRHIGHVLLNVTRASVYESEREIDRLSKGALIEAYFQPRTINPDPPPAPLRSCGLCPRDKNKSYARRLCVCCQHCHR